jgi:endonuclease/exonuclease/phosphatase family metal-dependent hydrolase
MTCIAFYNLENLFDTIDQEGVVDEEFTPEGIKNWNAEKYLEKLDNMGRAISLIGVGEHSPDGAVLLGVCELENATVLQDLAETEALKDRDYKFVHYDSPYYRGMDVALYYQPEHFTVLSSSSHELNMPEIENYTTRAQLLVTGILNGDTISVIVNHWPSRRGGAEESEPLRIAAARLSRSIADSLMNIRPNARIIIMGDLNDDPADKSVKNYLNTVDDIKKVTNENFYNPFEMIHATGVGTLEYRGQWNLFDQILLSASLCGKDNSSYTYFEAGILKEEFLIQQEGKYKGSPFRTYSYNDYIHGYSDHLPAYIYLVRK